MIMGKNNNSDSTETDVFNSFNSQQIDYGTKDNNEPNHNNKIVNFFRENNKFKYAIFVVGGILILIIIIVLAKSCGNNKVVQEIISDNEIVTYVNENKNLNFSTSKETKSTKFSFNIEDDSIAEIDNDYQIGSNVENEITGKKIGATTLEVVANLGKKEYKKEIPVIVCGRLDISGIAEDKLSVEIGKDIVLALNLGDDARCYATLNYTFGTNGIASITDEYTLRGDSVGTTTLKISDGIIEKEYDIEVIDPNAKILATSISISPSTSVTLALGETKQLEATILPADASDKSVFWSSDKSSNVTVDQTGVIEGLNIGTATITVMANDGSDKIASLKVTVASSEKPEVPEEIRVTSIKFDQEQYTGTVGGVSFETRIIFTPSDATNQTLKDCVPENTLVATAKVEGNKCIVTPLTAGETNLVAASVDGELKAKTKIIISAASTDGGGGGGGGSTTTGVCCRCSSNSLAGTGALVWNKNGVCSASCTKTSYSQAGCKNPTCVTTSWTDIRGCANQTWETSTQKSTCTNTKIYTGSCTCQSNTHKTTKVANCSKCTGICEYVPASVVGTGYYTCKVRPTQSGVCKGTSTAAATCQCATGYSKLVSTCAYTYRIVKIVCTK